MTETLSRRPGDDSEPEYTLAGTTSWLRAGSRESPTHRQRLGGHPTAQRFFYSWPVLRFPVLDGLVVSFEGASFGFLWAPVQTVH